MSESVAVSAVRVAVVQFDPQVGTQHCQSNLENSLNLALEAAENGVRINAVAPSIALHDFLKKAASSELLDQLTSREAFGRAAEVWEVANVMVFLASDYASYMVGEVLPVSSQQA